MPPTESITNSFVQFVELKLSTADRRCSANCASDFLLAAVRQTAPIIIEWQTAIAFQLVADMTPVSRE